MHRAVPAGNAMQRSLLECGWGRFRSRESQAMQIRVRGHGLKMFCQGISRGVLFKDFKVLFSEVLRSGKI